MDVPEQGRHGVEKLRAQKTISPKKPWKCWGMEAWKSLRGFPHYHGYGDDHHVSEDRQSLPKTRNQSHSHRKGLVNHVSGAKT
jgi:hypothetical protein